MNLHEKCAVFGIYSDQKDIARTVYYGLWALQHRGQENSGIVSTNGKQIYYHKGKGLVASVYNEKDLSHLKGNIAIGHNRYSTFGKSDIDHSQPVFLPHHKIAIAHNGNLPTVTKLKNFLHDKGISTANLNDSEMIHRSIEYWIVKGLSVKDAILKNFDLFTGAFSILVMTKNELIAVRDAYGVKPLSLGKLGNGHILSSETCAIDIVGGEFIRDVNPGEMIVINKSGMECIQVKKGETRLDIFELIYFARPDSNFFGKSVYEIRKRLGEQMAHEMKIDADVIIPVPDSSIPAAIGYSNASQIPLEHALIKNRYIHRTFITPSQKQRTNTVKMKLNIIQEVVKNKRVILIDDSIVRGTTSKRLADLLKQAGASEIHFCISSPPVLYPDFYGIDTPNQKELISFNMSPQEIAKHIGIQSVNFLSYNGTIKAIGINEEFLCTSCFSGKYPINIGSNAKKISVPRNVTEI